jgi:hypothetical protein
LDHDGSRDRAEVRYALDRLGRLAWDVPHAGALPGIETRVTLAVGERTDLAVRGANTQVPGL